MFYSINFLNFCEYILNFDAKQVKTGEKKEWKSCRLLKMYDRVVPERE